MSKYKFGSIVDRDFRNTLQRLADDATAQGKAIQDLVAEGQLSPAQYATFIKEFNGMIKKGELTPDDLSPELLNLIINSDGTPLEVLSIPRDDSVTIPKLTDNTIDTLKNEAFNKINEVDNELKTTFNLLGDTDNTNFIDSQKTQNTIISLSNDDSFIEVYGKKPKIMEAKFEPVDGLNSAVTVILKSKPNTTYYFNAWYKVSDLENLLQGDHYFNPYFLARDASNNSLGGAGNSLNTPGLSVNDLRVVGSEIGYTSQGTQSIKTRVEAIQNGWVNIRSEFYSNSNDLENIYLYHTRIARFNLSNSKVLRMTTPVITTKKLNPYVFPFSNIEEFNKYKETLNSELIPTIEEIVQSYEREKEISKLFNLLGDVTDSSFLATQSTAGANIKFNDDKVPNLHGKSHKVIEVNFDEKDGTGGNSYVAFNKKVTVGKEYYFGAWYNISDFKNLLGEENSFKPYFISYSESGETIGGLTTPGSIGKEDIEKKGLKLEFRTTVNHTEATSEILEVQNSWAYIRTKFKALDGNTDNITFYHTRIPSSVFTEQRVLRMSAPSLTENELNPYVFPYASEEELKNSVASPENIQALNSRVSTLEKADINSKWFGKELTVFGDSNSYNSGVTVWHQFLQSQLDLNVNNFARGGAGYIARSTTGIPPNIPVQIEQASGNPDLIVIFAGGNDYSLRYPLGSFGDTTMDTLYGALDISYKEAINKYPLSTICVFAQTRRASEGENSAGVSVEDQVNAQIEVAGKYSLPVLNLYHDGNVHPWNTTYRENRIPDGVHLSTEGHRALASKVKAFIETL